MKSELQAAIPTNLNAVLSSSIGNRFFNQIKFYYEHKLPKHVVTAFAPLHQHIEGTRFCCLVASTPLKPLRLQGIREKEQGVSWSTVAPIPQGVATDRQHGHTWRQVKAIATAVGLVDDGPTVQPAQQHGHIKTPAHQPERVGWSLLLSQQVIKKGMVGLALAVGNHLRGPQLR